MEPGDALVATIEASLALAGFSGIVVVLGRRGEGRWQPQEDLRLVNLLGSSMTAFFVSLLGVLLLTTDLPAPTSWRVCSAAWFVTVAFHSVWILLRSRQLEEEDLRRTNPAFFWFASVLTVVFLLLQLLNAGWLWEFWPVLGGIITNLVLGARQFVVLLRSGQGAPPPS